MITLQEIRSSLTGAFLLAKRAPDALSAFNLSTDGFYRSFYAMLLAAPVFAVENAFDYRTFDTATPFVPFILLLCLALWVSWGTYLFVMGLLTRFMGLGARYGTFAIVYNWVQFGLILIWLPVTVIAAGILPPGFGSLLNLIFIIATYAYLWYILKVTLNTTGLIAAGFAFLEFLVVVLVQSLFAGWLFTEPLL
tara:strand:+ start:649 stop:1230 length:582 start_codon:yes stop_codon:yes gene_type:complete